MNSQAHHIKDTLKKLPDAPGVYFFLGSKKEILYIGKATSLKDRVKSYFSRDLMSTRGPLLVKMLGEAEAIDYIETDSVLEALLLEAHQIRKHLPYYNSKEKDNRSHNYVIITKEDFPMITIVRGRVLAMNKELGIKNDEIIIRNSLFKIHKKYGPFPHGAELREALKIIRRIFPYRDEKCPGANAKRPCFNAQIGLCPGMCAGRVTKQEYRKTVRRIMYFFEGRKDTLIKDIEKDMKRAAKAEKFEEAEKLKRTLYALEHIQDVALIKRDVEREESENVFRIEAYDIAHMSGTSVVGVMTVVEDGELAKSQYRKFKIRAVKNDDVNNLREVLTRRLNHPEWTMPNLIVVDGGKAQAAAAEDVLKDSGVDVGVVSVVKDERHRAKEILYLRNRTPELERAILHANAEAHRFAIGYHRKLRGKGFRI